MTFAVPVSLLDMRAALRERVQLDANDPRGADTVLNTLINAAYHRFQIANPAGWPWDFSETIVALPNTTDIVEFAIGAGVGQPTKIRYLVLQHTSGLWEYPLERVTRADALSRYPKDSETGAPRVFSILGDPNLVAGGTAMQLRVRPKPDIAYNLLIGAATPGPDLVADADPTAATNDYAIGEYVDTVLDYAAYLAYRAREDLAEAVLGSKGEFDEGVMQLRRAARVIVGPGIGMRPVADDQELG